MEISPLTERAVGSKAEQIDHLFATLCPGVWHPGAMDDHTSNHLRLLLEWPQMIAVIPNEPRTTSMRNRSKSPSMPGAATGVTP